MFSTECQFSLFLVAISSSDRLIKTMVLNEEQERSLIIQVFRF